MASMPIETTPSVPFPPKTRRKVVPALMVFQMPPAAVATKKVFDGLGIPVMSLMRPPMLAGPMFRQRRPAISAESTFEVGTWAGSRAGVESTSRSAASGPAPGGAGGAGGRSASRGAGGGPRPGSGRRFMGSSTHGVDGLPAFDSDKCTPAKEGLLRGPRPRGDVDP